MLGGFAGAGCLGLLLSLIWVLFVAAVVVGVIYIVVHYVI